MPSIRKDRIAGEMQKALGDIIAHEVRDPAVPPVTSVVRVDVAADLTVAKVYISVLGEGDVPDRAVAALNKASGFIRFEMGKRVELRHLPRLTFVKDTSIGRSARISEILENIRHDEQAP